MPTLWRKGEGDNQRAALARGVAFVLLAAPTLFAGFVATSKPQEIKTELRKRMHHRVTGVGTWLRSVVEGHNRYYGVPSNLNSLASFRSYVARHWHWTLRRRSQTARLTREQMYRLINRWLPRPMLHHPYPLRRLGVIT